MVRGGGLEKASGLTSVNKEHKAQFKENCKLLND